VLQKGEKGIGRISSNLLSLLLKRLVSGTGGTRLRVSREAPIDPSPRGAKKKER